MIGWLKAKRASRKEAKELKKFEAAQFAASGDVRIPGATRGRMYERPGEDPGGAHFSAISERKARVHIKVTRADGTVEDHGFVEADVARLQ